jgi:amino acid transporter
LIDFSFNRTSTTLAVFAYQGVEIVVVAAGEAKYASRDVPRASRRIIFFALFVYFTMALLASLAVPFNHPKLQTYKGSAGTPTKGVSHSPFIIAIQEAGLGTGLCGFANACLYAAALTAA